MKSDYIERRVKLNMQASCIIRSRKDAKSDFYHNDIILVYSTTAPDPLQLHTRTALERAIKEIDIEDPQLNLLDMKVEVGSHELQE